MDVRKFVRSEIRMTGVVSGSYAGTMDDLGGVLCEDLEGHGVTNMISDTNEVPRKLGSIRTKAGILCTEVDTLPKTKAKEGTDVRSGAVENLQRSSPMENLVGGDVENSADIL